MLVNSKESLGTSLIDIKNDPEILERSSKYELIPVDNISSEENKNVTYLVKYDEHGMKSAIYVVNEFAESDCTIGYDLAIDDYGNVYIIGRFNKDKLFKTFVTKYSAEGIAKRIFEPKISVSGNKILVSKKGNIYIYGRYESKYSSCMNCVFIEKLNSEGDSIWVKTFQDNSSHLNFEVLNSAAIELDESENIFIVIHSKNGIKFQNIFPKIGHEDSFVIKLDSEGKEIWSNLFGDAEYRTIIYSLDLDSEGNIYIVGSIAGSNSRSLLSINGENGFLAKLDNNGNKIWNRFYGFTNYITQFHEVKIINKDIFLVGSTSKNLIKKSHGALNKNIFLRKYSLEGKIIKSIPIPIDPVFKFDLFSYLKQGVHIDINLEGNIYITGVKGNDDINEKSSHAYDGFIMRLHKMNEFNFQENSIPNE
ncbi:SBBP repeat-containing protein [Silvanigrella aquatica]|uniref:Uncharacterized protein n=1 Tax=Silvanigrella aquatica TaxID=1915309 RepID=A0A1L4D320_9BACT|nr:SBBP repeat-containing protein [Silvanigrella aquatica]APJ04605.1 hypothetical protein AXG55_12090 [Silvanigrella aquatica]